MPKPRVMICVPTRGNPCYELTQWLVKMRERATLPDCPYELKIIIGKAGHQNPTNNALLNAALMDPFQWTHYLKIDDDLVPDENMIERLLDIDKDVIGVGVAIWRESLNGVFIAASNFDKEKGYIRVPMETEKIGPAYYVGGGCMMIKRHVLESMKTKVWKYNSDCIYGDFNNPDLPPPDSPTLKLQPVPVWSFDYDNNGMIGTGSDELFCKKARDMGFEIYYDCTHILEQHTDLLVGASEVEGIFAIDIHQNKTDAGKKRMVTKEDYSSGRNVSTRWSAPPE